MTSTSPAVNSQLVMPITTILVLSMVFFTRILYIIREIKR
jgi:hypothetical protein